MILGAEFDIESDLCSLWKSFLNKDIKIDCEKDYIRKNLLRDKYLGICECAKMGVNAAHKAWDNSMGIDRKVNSERWGVMVGTAFGECTSLYANQCKTLVKQGPMWLMPSAVTNKGPKTTADVLAIEKKLKGANLTFESGRISSGMAILHAFDEITFQRLDGVVVIGTEYIDDYLKEATGILKRCISNYASGACSIILTSEDEAVGITPKARLLTVEAVGGDGKPFHFSNNLKFYVKRVILQVLKKANLETKEIDVLIYSGTNNEAADVEVYMMLFSIFGEKTDILSTTECLGDFIGANSIIAVGVSLVFFSNQCIIRDKNLIYKELKHILILTSEPSGNTWAGVLEKY